MSGVLRKHEIRHLLNAACEREEEVWKCRIENGLPKNEMPFLFAVQVTEDRGWFQKGEKVYIIRPLANRTQFGDPVLKRNDERLHPIGPDHFECWKSEL